MGGSKTKSAEGSKSEHAESNNEASAGLEDSGLEDSGLAIAGLDEHQRALVRGNVGLVAVHIRRNVRNVNSRRVDRDYEDLFQEGCCGLIQAARTFDPAKGIPFAAFALRRIHTAVSGALYESASPIRRPRRRSKKDANPAGSETSPKVFQLENDPRDSRHQPDPLGGEDTLGDRVRAKIETAMSMATRSVDRRRAPRGDRRALMDMLIRDRLLIAEPTAKTSLREIARQTNSSYTRVLQCERRILQAVRQMLSGDLEFLRLLTMIRQDQRGTETPVDDDMRAELRRLAATVFVGRLQSCDARRRERLLWDLVAKDRDKFVDLLERLFDDLDDQRISAIQIEAARMD